MIYEKYLLNKWHKSKSWGAYIRPPILKKYLIMAYPPSKAAKINFIDGNHQYQR